jgi:hypothetical protein
VRHHRQERWLHARISEHLEDALKREARRKRQPVSLLVRNVLEGALDLVEDIVEDGLAVAQRSHRLARNLGRSAKAASGDGLDDVYGWQELILNRAATCARCETDLTAGASAHRGLRDQPGSPIFLCTSCVRRLRQPRTHSEEETR